MHKSNTFNQDNDNTQALQGTADQEIVRKIAGKIRSIRMDKNLTIQQLAERAKVTKGLLSKIENSRTIPSLPVFVKILKSLGVAFQDFFKAIETQEKQHFILMKSHGPSLMNNSISAIPPNSSKVQMSFLSIRTDSSREFGVLPGYRFIHLISGVCQYCTQDSMIQLRGGDSLYFDGRVLHLLLNSSGEDAKLLVIDFFV